MPQGEGPKVVFCTVENDVGQVARALHAGANEHLLKPFDKRSMTARLQHAGLL
jgi:two-component system chemotaxis response regulator CheY